MKKLVVTFTLFALFAFSYSQTSPSSQQVGSYDWKIQSGSGTMANPSIITLDGTSDNTGGSLILESGTGYAGSGNISLFSNGQVFFSANGGSHYLSLNTSNSTYQSISTNSSYIKFLKPITVSDDLTTTGDLTVSGNISGTQNVDFPKFIDSDNSSYFVDPSSSSTSMILNGAVGIGTTTIPTGYKLAVNGKFVATEVLVELYNDWPDYVFSDDYNIMPIGDLENYIKKHNHLPNIPSAKEIEADGQNLGEMQILLLQKVEELTLYIIDLENRNQALEERINNIDR